MKFIFAPIFLSLFCIFSVAAQTYGDYHFSGVENDAVFEGGMNNFYKIVSKNLHSVDDKIGRVYIQFLIDTTGKMSEFKVLKGLSEKSDAEVLRLMKWINEKYSWKPRLVRGQKVQTRQSLPIIFKEENTIPVEINDSLQNVELDLSFLDSIKIPQIKIERKKEEEDIVFCYFDGSIATFEGGMDNFYKAIRENLRFPEEGKAGRVFIKFVIDTTGKMTDFEIMESPSEQNSNEVLRMMSLINEKYSWKPATSRGKKVKVRMTLPINFYLDKKKKSNTEKIYRR